MKNIGKRKKSIQVLKVSLIVLAVFLLSATLGACGRSVNVPAGNLANYGYTLVDGNDVYYSKIIVNGGDWYSTIYKYDTKTQTEVLVSVLDASEANIMNGFLTLSGGELYFLANYLDNCTYEDASNISVIKPDGKNPEDIRTLFESDDLSCKYMQIVDNTIYFYDTLEMTIYKVNKDGTNLKVVCETDLDIRGMYVDNGTIYYAEDEILYSVSAKGGIPKVIYDIAEQEPEDEDADFEYFYFDRIAVDGNYIYYMNDEWTFIGRVKTDGTDNKVIYEVDEDSPSNIQSFTVSDGTVYFVLDSYGAEDSWVILATTPGATKPRVVVDDKNNYGDILPISIWGDTIYYLALPSYETIMDSDYVWFTVNKNGGKITPFQPFTVYSDTFGIDDYDYDDEDYVEDEGEDIEEDEG